MKILTVRFANLNSLAGEWKIDFNHPEYSASGIFAITGATGAGKSTILDAISLALYGRTPRLKTISKKSNEAMSRQTGSCFSEVDFLTAKGHFRCHWSQHRSRKKPSGELQSPRHELVDARSDKILESKIRDVAQKVLEVTGMNFDQFTRSMLLAQGDFNKFLQASSDQRAPILEQLTGTEIYSRVSQQVHQRKSEEETELNQLQSGLEGHTLMDEDEERAYRFLLTELQAKTDILQKDIHRKREQQTWLITLRQLKEAVSELTLKEREAAAQWQGANDQRELLTQAEAAKLLLGNANQLSYLRSAQKADQQDLSGAQQQLEKEQKDQQETTILQTSREKLFADALRKQKLQNPILSEVREIDLLKNQQLQDLESLQKAIHEERKKIIALTNQHVEFDSILARQKSTAETITTYLHDHAQEAELLETYTGIKERLISLSSLHIVTKKIEKQLNVAVKHGLEATLKNGECQKILEKAAKDLQREQEQLDLTKKKLKAESISDLPELYGLFQKAKERLSECVAILHVLKDSSKQKNILAATEKKQAQLKEVTQSLENDLAKAEPAYALLKMSVAKQEEIVILANKVQSYEEERKKLEEETPCPLCGSKQHPYTEGAETIPDKARQQLRNERDLLEQATTNKSILEAKLNTTRVEIRKNEEAQAERLTQLQALESEVAQRCSRFAPPLSLAECAVLQQKEQELIEEVEVLTGNIQRAETLNRKKNQQEEVLQSVREILVKNKEQLQSAINTDERFKESTTRLQAELLSNKAEQERSIHILNSVLAPYNLPPVTPEKIDEIEKQLVAIRNSWKAKTGEFDKLLVSNQKIQAKLDQLNTSLRHIEEERLQKETAAGLMQNKLLELTTKRTKLFGSDDPEKAELKVVKEIETYEKLLKKITESIHQCAKTIAALHERTTTLKQSTEKRAIDLQKETQLFQHKLKICGFQTEERFRQALMAEEEYNSLKHSIGKLKETLTAVATLLRDKTAALEKEETKILTDNSLVEINAVLIAKTKILGEVQQETGAAKNKLNAHEQSKAEQAKNRVLLASQKKEYAHWSRLHDLIGSADGKKFRNFAQGLTFEVMVYHANRTLKKMTDRYLLVRNSAHPLELNVIDNHQAGEIRSTSNLSGGESFIVSLALALGLAGMASRKVQVDSLFLDEGFGTLDEDSLEVALETLSTLQQEGKIIGIISHVPLLKERIGVQIHIMAGLDGKSKITGPGVTR